MRRCTACFRFHPGHPTYCSNCGRSFGVRLCPRGHINPRGTTFCSDCGSSDLSTPAPPASLLHHLSGFALYGFAAVVAGVLAIVVVLSALRSLNVEAVMGPLVMLLLMLGFLYWTTTLLPGPIKKVGKAVGKGLMNAARGKKKGTKGH